MGSTLAGLAERELAEVVDRLDAEGRAAAPRWSAHSLTHWRSMTSQLRSWLEEKRSFSRECRDLSAQAHAFVAERLEGEMERALLPGIDPLVDPLVLSIEAARARDLADGGEGEQARILLPHHPLSLWRDGDPPAVRDLVLAAHLVGRFDSVRQEGGRAAAVLEEHRRLRGHLDWMLDSPERRSDLERLGTEVRERLRYRKPQVAFDLVETLLVEAARPGSGADQG